MYSFHVYTFALTARFPAFNPFCVSDSFMSDMSSARTFRGKVFRFFDEVLFFLPAGCYFVHSLPAIVASIKIQTEKVKKQPKNERKNKKCYNTLIVKYKKTNPAAASTTPSGSTR